MRNWVRRILRRVNFGERSSVLYLYHFLKWELTHDNQIAIAIFIARSTVVQSVIKYISEHGCVIFLCVWDILLELHDNLEQQRLLEREDFDAMSEPTLPKAGSTGAFNGSLKSLTGCTDDRIVGYPPAAQTPAAPSTELEVLGTLTSRDFVLVY